MNSSRLPGPGDYGIFAQTDHPHDPRNSPDDGDIDPFKYDDETGRLIKREEKQ